jgi:peptide/nickel transport system substrate-binding protein
MKTRALWVVLSTTLLAVAGLQGVIAQPSTSSTLVLATEGSPPTFDPLLAGSDSRVNTPAINIYNALFQVEPGTSVVVPELATGYEVSDDGLTYTFTLRDDVDFHDGSPVTADDVVYTVERMLALGIGTYRNFGNVEGAESVDDHTVRIHLSAPFPGMIQALTRLYILNADLVRANEREGDWGQTWLQSNSAGSGPYTLVSFQPEQQFTIDAVEDYWQGWHDDFVERAIFRVIREESTRRLALQRGEVDWIRVGSADAFNDVQTIPGVVAETQPTLNQLYFAFYTDHPQLSDPRVRRALSLAYDYQGHAEIIRQGFADVARGAFPPGIPYFDESQEPATMDIEQARALMAEAGVPDGGFTLEMAYQGTSPEETSAMQLMQSGAAQLGVTVRPVAVEWPAKIELYSNPATAPGLGTIWIYPSYPDPDVFVYPLGHSSQAGQLNFAYYRNDRFDEVIEAARSEVDAERREELYLEAQELWLEDVPYMNVVVGQTLSAWRDYVHDFKASTAHALTIHVYPMRLDGKP